MSDLPSRNEPPQSELKSEPSSEVSSEPQSLARPYRDRQPPRTPDHRNKWHWCLALLLFATAVGVRLAPATESYWVDELHSAWVVNDSIGVVTSRAGDGHQQPLYFYLLWGWNRVVGSSEVMMRMTSILAMAGTAVLLFLGIAWHHAKLLAGLIGGAYLALDSNAIFFGTELRPYAAVVLMSAIACVCTANLWKQDAAIGRGSGAWAGLLLSIGFSTAFQITSAGVLVWLPLFVLARWSVADLRSTIKPRLNDLLAIAILAALYLSLSASDIDEVWQERRLWASFASAERLSQMLELWPWVSVVVVPLAILVVGQLFAADDDSSENDFREQDRAAAFTVLWLFAVVVLISTLVFWLAAYVQFAAVWHRRYLVACLPMLAWVFAGGVAEGTDKLFAFFYKPVRAAIGFAVSLILFYMVLSGQGTLTRLSRGQWLVYRGENWRDAIEDVNQFTNPGDTVWLNPGLIEQQAFADADRRLRRDDYLRYVLDGPYSIRQDVQVQLCNHRNIELLYGSVAPQASEFALTEPSVILTRGASTATIRQLRSGFKLRRYGNVLVAMKNYDE